MWEGILTGLYTAFDINNFFWVVAGCLAGTFVGMVPGLGPITAIALMIPISYSLEPAAGMIMMAGVYYGAVFGGSTSAILINAPGVASTVATSFDGYPMARSGQGGRALAIAAYSSFVGGTIGALVLMFFASVLAGLAMGFQSPDYALVLIIALSSIAAFSEPADSLKAIVMALFGLMLGTIGTDQSAGIQRFTFGLTDLTEGIPFILLAMATFALGEAFRMIIEGDETNVAPASQARLHAGDASRMKATVARSSLLGFFIGILPGAGATLASFVAYDTEKRFHPTGKVRGIAAPEAANNAACTGSFVPLLTLGIPGSGTTAILLGVMLGYGIQPGPHLLASEPEIFWGVIISMYIGNLVLLGLNLPLIPYISKIIYIQKHVLIPFVIAFSLLGVYLTTVNPFHVFLMLGFGILAIILRSASYPLAPLLLGFILSGMLEENLRRTLYLSDGSLAIFFETPLTATLSIICITLWALTLRKSIRSGTSNLNQSG